MKITAIVCGRKNQQSERIARIALKSAKEIGAEVELINLMNLKIKPCIDCKACVRAMREPDFKGKCPLNDDMAWLDEQILSSDGLIFVAPMFENAAPGPYKIMCDRMGPSHDVTFLRGAKALREAAGIDPMIDERWFKSRPAAFIGHGGSEWSFMSFPTLAIPAISMGMTIVDYIRMDWNSDLMLDDLRLNRIRQCGAHVAAQAGKNPGEMSYIGPAGVCAACHCDVMRIVPESGEAYCACCGAPGKLSVVAGKVVVAMDADSMRRSHLFETGRQIHMDDLRNNARVRAAMDQTEVRRRVEPLIAEIPVSIPHGD